MGTSRRGNTLQQAEHGSVKISVSGVGGGGPADRVLGPLEGTGALRRGHQKDISLGRIVKCSPKMIEDLLLERIMDGVPRRIEDRLLKRITEGHLRGSAISSRANHGRLSPRGGPCRNG